MNYHQAIKITQLLICLLLLQVSVLEALGGNAQLRGSEGMADRNLIVSDILRASADLIDGFIDAIFGFIRDLFNL